MASGGRRSSRRWAAPPPPRGPPVPGAGAWQRACALQSLVSCTHCSYPIPVCCRNYFACTEPQSLSNSWLSSQSGRGRLHALT